MTKFMLNRNTDICICITFLIVIQAQCINVQHNTKHLNSNGIAEITKQISSMLVYNYIDTVENLGMRNPDVTISVILLSLLFFLSFSLTI